MALCTSSLLMAPAVGQLLAGAAGSCALPALQHGLRVLQVAKRGTSFQSLAAPRPARAADEEASSKQDDAVMTTAFAWTFAPLARELTRTAGGFEHRARWPLGGPSSGSSSLLDLALNSSSSTGSSSRPRLSLSASYAFARHHSVMPHSAGGSGSVGGAAAGSALSPPAAQQQQQQCHEHTAAAAAPELPLELQQAAGAAWVSQWLPKAQPRVKGLSRKLVLRQINRKIISRVARRATIGIPVLGFYFVSKLVMKDIARVRSELAAGEYAIAGLFGTAVVADILDLAAQMTIITGLAHANLGMGLASAAALLVAADKASLATAALSFSCALAGESIALKRAAELASGSSSE